VNFWRRLLGLEGSKATLDGRVEPPAPKKNATHRTFNLGDGSGFEMGIVGESYYGLEIKRIAGDRLARGEEVCFQVTIVREPDNEHDSNAVAVIGSHGEEDRAFLP
jgi:hypothetical protein